MTAPAGSAPPPPQVVIPGAGWVDVASRAITTVGFPVVIAGVLLWFLLTRFQANMDAIVTRMGHNTEVVSRLIEEEEATVAELVKHSRELSEQTVLMRQIAADGGKLVEVRTEEVEMLRQIVRERGARGAEKAP